MLAENGKRVFRGYGAKRVIGMMRGKARGEGEREGTEK